MGRDVGARNEAVLPPRPMEEEAERREVPLPWIAAPVALLLGTVAGSGYIVRDIIVYSYPGGLTSSAHVGVWVFVVGATNCGLAAVFALSDRLLGHWRREVRWPLAVVPLWLIAAAFLVILDLFPPTWGYGMDVSEVVPFTMARLVRDASLAFLLAVLCRSRKGLAWKALAAGVAFEILLAEAYVVVSGWLGDSRMLDAGWWDVSLLSICPAGLALSVAVCGAMQWARAQVGIAEPAPGPSPVRRRRWRRGGAVILLVVIGLLGLRRLGHEAFFQAIKQHDAAAVSRWVALGVDPDCRPRHPWMPALHAAARTEDVELAGRS